MAGPEPVRILFVGATPTNHGSVYVAREFEAIRRQLENSHRRDHFELRVSLAVSLVDFSGLLLEYKPDIVHYAGHGNELGELLFEGESDSQVFVDSRQLAKLFSLFQKRVRCVVLSAANSGHQAKLIAEYVDVAIGAQGQISDLDAIAFTVGFYKTISLGVGIAKAFELATIALALSKSEAKFVLHARHDVNPAHLLVLDDDHAVAPTRAATGGAPSLDFTTHFFESVGRKVQIEDRNVLRIPELVVLASGETLAELDLDLVEHEAEKGSLSYVIHEGPIPETVREQLGGLCIRGWPTITLAVDSMRAGLQDGNSRAIFAEHTRLGTRGINLFESSNAIANPALFFGRTELINRVGGALSRGDATMITGIRKSGKSSFLHILRQNLSKRPVAWLDLQLLDRSDPRWHERAFARILNAWDRWGIGAMGKENWTFAKVEKLVAKPDFIEQVDVRWALQSRLYPEDRMLVVLDELERVLPDAAQPAQADSFESFTSALRSLAQAAEPVLAIIAADLRPEANRLNVLPNGHTNPWFRFFVEVPLPLLSYEEVTGMVDTIARRMGASRVERAFIERLHGYSGGHAYLTRLLAASAWAERTNPEVLAESDFERGLHKLEDHANVQQFFRENIWNPLTVAERTVLLEAGRTNALRRWWERISGRRQDSEAAASLRMLGLLADSGITIGGLADWLRQTDLEPTLLAGKGAFSGEGARA